MGARLLYFVLVCPRCFNLFGLSQVTLVCRCLCVVVISFQVVLGCFNWCSVVLGGSSCFRMCTRWFGAVVDCFKLF